MFRRKRKSSDFRAEIVAHIELERERLQEQGMSREEAQSAARRTFGNVTHAEERFYESRRWLWWDHFQQDVRFGARMLARNPGFTVTVILTLALSVGANTAIFSLVNALLLKSLPYSHPERLAALYAKTTGPDAYNMRRDIDGEQWELLRDGVPSLLSAVSAGMASGVNLQGGAHVQYLHAGRVSAHYFDVLGLHPVLGRNFSEDEDRPQGPKTVILGYALWRTAFGANPQIVGQAALLKGEPYTIIGVLPERATTPLNADVYVALQPSREGEGGGTNFEAIMRLRDSATWQQADAELNSAWAQSHYVQFVLKRNSGVQITYYLVPLQKGQTDSLQQPVLAVMLAAGFILLIACANLAGLTLVRMLRRTSEIATRVSLGASLWHVQLQLWIENLLLALVGGAAGVCVGAIALRSLLLLLPQHFLPVAEVSLDGRVLTFTLALALLTSVFFGMLPALVTRKIDLRSAIASRGIVGGGAVRLRQSLIVGEVALTVVLLAAAGLLIRTLIHLETMTPGFNSNGVLAAKASLDDVRYHDPAKFRNLLAQSVAAMRQISGVQNAAVGLTLPYERALIDGVTLAEGKEAGQVISTDEIYVTPGYFETLQIPVLAGRSFTDADGPDATKVVIVNQAFARQFLHSANPVGRYLTDDSKQHALIVGVVENTVGSSAGGLTDDRAPLTSQQTVYIPAAQILDSNLLRLVHAWFQPSWIVRTESSMDSVGSAMQNAMGSVDPNLPFSGFYGMKDLMAKTLAIQRLEVALLVTMASLALLLSAVGIFALVANIVVHKKREIGIRMALGSTIGQAMYQIGRSGVVASLAGVALGLMLAAGALRAIRGALFGVDVYDVPTLAVIVVTLLLVTLLASILPTLKIARIDPASTLREE
ncbi:MAG: ABC transporter permease [Candidatus Acidiferrum sp.]